VPLEPLRKRSKIQPFEVYDIETTTDLKRVYLVGWYNGVDYQYWESIPLPPEHPESAMSLFLKWRFHHPTRSPQYAHNGGNFDAVFALSSIIAQFKSLEVEIIPSQSSILLMKVIDKETRSTWKFLDSARTLPDSLDNLGKCFLNEGKIEIDDYATLHLNPNRYAYLKRDCTLLYNVLSKYFRLLYDKLGGQAGISAASTALATYRSSYQPRPLPEISEHATQLARAGYYGGRCEPFRREFRGQQPIGRRTDTVVEFHSHIVIRGETKSVGVLHCYDVNSMYPWAMRQHQPIEELDVKGYHSELTGFVDCDIDVSNCHMPILPCRKNNRLLFPVGRWRGTFSTCELRMAEAVNQARVLHVYDSVYFRTADIFSQYVDTLYKFRNKDSPDWELSLDRMAKIALNSLYGKFGSQEVRETIHIRPSFDDMVNKQMQQMPSSVSVDCYIERTIKHSAYMLPQISAWITALGRVKLVEGLLTARRENVFYCDTDSIYTSSEMETGSLLGEWKDEYVSDPIVYAYFLSPKVYVLEHLSGKVTNKAKGFSKFGKEKLPPNAVALLASGEALEVSRFAKARSVIRGDFGLMLATKRCHMDYEKRIFHKDGSSEPRRVDLE
jgi:hypothetical protein